MKNLIHAILAPVTKYFNEKGEAWYIETAVTTLLSQIGLNNLFTRILYNIIGIQIVDLIKLYCKEEEMFLFPNKDKNKKRTKL